MQDDGDEYRPVDDLFQHGRMLLRSMVKGKSLTASLYRLDQIDQAQNGIYLPRNRRDAIEVGRFSLLFRGRSGPSARGLPALCFADGRS